MTIKRLAALNSAKAQKEILPFWHSPRKFISWMKPSKNPEKSRVSLFGDFTADELEAIAVFMRGKK